MLFSCCLIIDNNNIAPGTWQPKDIPINHEKTNVATPTTIIQIRYSIIQSISIKHCGNSVRLKLLIIYGSVISFYNYFPTEWIG